MYGTKVGVLMKMCLVKHSSGAAEADHSLHRLTDCDGCNNGRRQSGVPLSGINATIKYPAFTVAPV